MQKNIKRLLKKKNFETINDSTILRMLKIVDELLSLLFIKDSDIKQKLMNINKKLKRIDSNTFKTKTDIDTYAIAIKKKRFDEIEKTQNARRELVAKTKQQKFFTKFKRRKTLMLKINNEEKKAFIRHLFIKNLMQKLITMKKKKKDVFSMRRLFSEDLKLLANFEEIRTRIKRNLTLMNDITSSTTTMKRTYVVLTHDVRLSSVNTLNQKTTMKKIVKQNNTLHKNLNILRIAWTKKIIDQRKKFFFLIIKIVNSEMTNRLIKEELLNEHTHLICEYFEKECRIKQCFKCQRYDHVNKTCKNSKKCEQCAQKHSTKDCRIAIDHRSCVNCENKHSTWSFQCDVKTTKKRKLNIIWKNKSILHIETSRNTSVKQNAKERINEFSTIISFTEISQIIERMTFTNEQKKSTLMSLNLNEITNRFFTLSSIIDKRSCNQNFVDRSSRFNKRFVNVIQINSSQRKMNAFALFRYKFKSSSRLKRSFNKSTSSSYQSNSNTQNTRNSKKW